MKRVAVVTGGTKGIGLAVARKLAATDCQVFVNYAHDDEAAARVQSELDCELLKGDVFAPGGGRELLAKAQETAGRLDVFVHNAARWSKSPADDVSASLTPLVDVLDVLPSLMPDGGRVVAVSSNGANRVVPGYLSLGVAKAALESLVRYAAVQLAGKGIAVNAVSTGKVDKGPDTVNPEPMRILAARTPAGRLTVPSDVADAVWLLCADEAAWIHGQVLTADGGLGLLA
ncbi:SDR family oxidoreductase [Kutzneria sp. CA-103260]|uniref:SDR family oxidoreductase n=1 Tax=Kutzneria sp. CA-103260 TaxID=2802641 RepID=UPI001BA86DAF|nr:SDR family oxidoreductase [Kutzneria sp. CA-103260]QUQ63857.1 3-oxoacyl-ACP reductase [Kutzneria sp. CA-103260]